MHCPNIRLNYDNSRDGLRRRQRYVLARLTGVSLARSLFSGDKVPEATFAFVSFHKTPETARKAAVKEFRGDVHSGREPGRYVVMCSRSLRFAAVYRGVLSPFDSCLPNYWTPELKGE